jgi:hypothetical protein
MDILRYINFEPSNLVNSLTVPMNIIITDNHFAYIPLLFLFCLSLNQLSEILHTPNC